jgi:hypothetical protein
VGTLILLFGKTSRGLIITNHNFLLTKNISRHAQCYSMIENHFFISGEIWVSESVHWNDILSVPRAYLKTLYNICTIFLFYWSKVMMKTYGSISILIVLMLGSLCLLSAAFTAKKKKLYSDNIHCLNKPYFFSISQGQDWLLSFIKNYKLSSFLVATHFRHFCCYDDHHFFVIFGCLIYIYYYISYGNCAFL